MGNDGYHIHNRLDRIRSDTDGRHYHHWCRRDLAYLGSETEQGGAGTFIGRRADLGAASGRTKETG